MSARFGGSAGLGAVLLLAGCAPDPGCETLEWAFERQTERVRALSQYVDGAARLACRSARNSVRDSILVARGFEAGDIGSSRGLRCWGLHTGFRGRGAALPVRNVAQELAKLTERARPRAEAAGCACLPWSEAVAVWAAGGDDRGPPDFDFELYRLATSRAEAAADTCWCEAWGPVGGGWPHTCCPWR